MHADAFRADAGRPEAVLDVPVFAHPELDGGELLALEVLPRQLELQAARVPLFLAVHRLGEGLAGLGVADRDQLRHGV